MKVSRRIWSSIIIFGFFGQLAWMVENMYFNVFLYNTVTDNPRAIASMVAASAITATVTTLLMGALSDKIGKRRFFIIWGYIIWGLTTMSFAFMTVENTQKIFPTLNAVTVTAVIIVIMDCVMTFFGSTANDGAFNAWVTDVVDTNNRGKVESVLAALPLIAMLVIFGAFDGLTKAGNWKGFYIIIGSIVTLGGILGFFIIKDKEDLKPNNQKYFKNILYGFKLSTFKENKMLYLTFTTLTILNISYQIFLPYLIIYIQRYLGIDNYAIPLAIILVLSAVFSVIMGSVMDKVGRKKFMIPTVMVLIIGFIGVYFSRTLIPLAIMGTVMMGANLIECAAVSGTIRDYTPADRVGLFQGVRMFFAVLLPMIIGPFIGSSVIINSNETYEELGVIKQVPTPNIFIAAAIIAAFSLIPMVIIIKNKKESEEAK